MRPGSVIILAVAIALLVTGAITYKQSYRMPTENPENALSLTSPAFLPNGTIPSEYTCDGNRTTNPPLVISGVPEGAKSLVLIMDDPDIPQEVRDARDIEAFDHWVLYNIPPETTQITENFSLGTEGLNGAGTKGYTGPCPPPQYMPKEHRYVFKLYALDGMLEFGKPPTKVEVMSMLLPMILAQTELVGRYERK